MANVVIWRPCTENSAPGLNEQSGRRPVVAGHDSDGTILWVIRGRVEGDLLLGSTACVTEKHSSRTVEGNTVYLTLRCAVPILILFTGWSAETATCLQQLCREAIQALEKRCTLVAFREMEFLHLERCIQPTSACISVIAAKSKSIEHMRCSVPKSDLLE